MQAQAPFVLQQFPPITPCARYHVGAVTWQLPPTVESAPAKATSLLVPPTLPSVADSTETVFELGTGFESMPTLGGGPTAPAGIGIGEFGVPAAGMLVGPTVMMLPSTRLLGDLVSSSPSFVPPQLSIDGNGDIA